MLVEFVVGRRTNRNPVGALSELGQGLWQKVGWLFVATGFLILSYYSVVAGWTIRYVLIGLQDGYVGNVAGANEQFGSVASGLDAVLLHAIFMAAVIGIVALGIQKGIEFSVKLMVPAIIAITIGLAAYAFTLDGAGEAYAYYLSPDISVIVNEFTSVLPGAAGQAFFTLSLGMGVMITYASYLDEDRNLVEDGLAIVGLDTLIAFTVGLIVFPILFTAGIDPGDPGAGAIFVSLAAAFAELPFGGIIGAVFFATVAIAALSSAISIMEVVVSYLIDEWDVGRVPATVVLGVGLFIVGLPAALDIIFVDVYDLFVNNVLLVLGALLVSIFVGWIVPELGRSELRKGIGDLGIWGTGWIWLVRIPVIITLLVTIALGAMGYYDFLTTDFADWLNETL
ncbi:sodium:neurotransmitter symporter [Natrialba taiwanensis DSM 12281]|uniref:Sodium:neurotransmitter symporter n=2 Tax=Natrialba taiwanensis TaxID=160846 RepID=L9ZFF2_9EURY|nr:sodium:neurotransmitter symporter [Natrialba taiwanensis DSM 12281]